MEPQPGPRENDLPEHHIVRADEVDQTGTDISTVPDEQLIPELVEGFKREDAENSNDDEFAQFPQRHQKPSGRPELRRDQLAPPPPMKPPPPAPTENPPDSLSLAQLRKIVQEMPKADQPAYAFKYADSQPFPEELDEWFGYNEPDHLMLLGSKVSFEQSWPTFCQTDSNSTTNTNQTASWIDADDEARATFVKQMLECFDHSDLFTRIEALEIICYLICGVWGLTAGRVADDYPADVSDQESAECPKSKSLQITWTEKNVLLVYRCGGIPALFEYLRKVFDKDQLVYSFSSFGLFYFILFFFFFFLSNHGRLTFYLEIL